MKPANYLSFIQKHPIIQSHPSPLGHGWQLVNGLCLPVRYDQPALPLSLQLVTTNVINNEEDSDRESDDEYANATDSDFTDSSSFNQ